MPVATAIAQESTVSAIVNLKVNSSAQLDRSFLALSHPARRRIVERLALGSATVGEATEGLRISKPAVTKHVRLLEQAGLVTRTIEGRAHRLRLAPSAITEPAEWLEHHRALWEAKLDVIEQHLQETEDAR